MEQIAEAALSAAELSEESASHTVVRSDAASLPETGTLMKGLAKGAGDMEGLQQTLNEGETQTGEANRIIIDIAADVENITGLVEGISHISAQTNILSMNAAIESAHAGSAGAGFAVVADEIKKLAESTAKNTKEIQIQIKAIAEKTRAGLKAGNRSVQTIGKIKETMAETGSLLSELAEQLSGHAESGIAPGNPPPTPEESAGGEIPAADGHSNERLSRLREDLHTQQEQLRSSLDSIKVRISGISPENSPVPETPPAEPAVKPAPSIAQADTKKLEVEDTLDSKGVAVKEEPRIIL
jgi:hypothetical protein